MQTGEKPGLVYGVGVRAPTPAGCRVWGECGGGGVQVAGMHVHHDAAWGVMLKVEREE